MSRFTIPEEPRPVIAAVEMLRFLNHTRSEGHVVGSDGTLGSCCYEAMEQIAPHSTMENWMEAFEAARRPAPEATQ